MIAFLLVELHWKMKLVRASFCGNQNHTDEPARFQVAREPALSPVPWTPRPPGEGLSRDRRLLPNSQANKPLLSGSAHFQEALWGGQAWEGVSRRGEPSHRQQKGPFC